ncbi:MAG: glycosyltransferase [Verrucomicrobiota bacterium]
MKRLFIDHTKTLNSTHHSGLNRVNVRLAEELKRLFPRQVFTLRWERWSRSFREVDTGKRVKPTAEDDYLIGEAFDPNKLWRWQDSIERWPGKAYAIFHDNIPGIHPELCLPHVVKRHPRYLAALSNFDHIFSVSKASAVELRKALGEKCPKGSYFPLGVDFDSFEPWDSTSRESKLSGLGRTVKGLMVGIIEPRKNQESALAAQRILAAQGLNLELDIVGRLNDYFGKAIARKIEAQSADGFPVRYRGSLSDAEMEDQFRNSDVLLFPSIAEGFGLPPFEAMARGLPTISNCLPSVYEGLDNAPIIWIDEASGEGLAEGIKRFVDDVDFRSNFVERLMKFRLPRWKDSAEILAEQMGLG